MRGTTRGPAVDSLSGVTDHPSHRGVDPQAVPRHAVLRFWAVATALEVVLALALVLTGGDAVIADALAATGLSFDTDLVTAVRLVLLYPAAAWGVGRTPAS